jgi:hypothetical protein
MGKTETFPATLQVIKDCGRRGRVGALQTEIQKHNPSTFTDAQDKVVMTGCSFCRKHFGTIEQFKRHITEDVLPPLPDKLSVEAK